MKVRSQETTLVCATRQHLGGGLVATHVPSGAACWRTSSLPSIRGEARAFCFSGREWDGEEANTAQHHDVAAGGGVRLAQDS